jgi:putative thioredoxin
MSMHDIVDFPRDVLARSRVLPVVVDFWAEWCGPCRVLGPVLESLAEAAGGAWELKKLNTEDFPDIATQYGVQSIPCVMLFMDGRVVDEFVGALPEQAVLAWLDKALPDPFAHDVARAELLHAGGQVEDARAILEMVLDARPSHEAASVLLAATLFFADRARALALVASIETGPAAERAEAIRQFAALLSALDEPQALAEGPMRDQYREALNALGRMDFTAALERFIEVLRRDRYYMNDSARKACIAIFKFLGEDHDTTRAFRREFDRSFY